MPHRLRVCDMMARGVVTAAEDDTLEDARAWMERAGVRHLPVVRGGRLVGLITHRDLLAASFSVFRDGSAAEEHRLFSSTPVNELMHDALTVSPDTTLRVAAEMLLTNRFGCLPVVDGEGRLLGIVTEADFVRLVVHMLDAINA